MKDIDRYKDKERRKKYRNEYRRKRWKDNPEKIKEYTERKKENDRQWNKNHREYRNYMDMIRRMKLKEIEGNFTLEEWQNKKNEFDFICPLCNRKEPEIKLSIDHIVPISRNGTNWIANIQPLCKNCNSSKGKRLITIH